MRFVWKWLYMIKKKVLNLDKSWFTHHNCGATTWLTPDAIKMARFPEQSPKKYDGLGSHFHKRKSQISIFHYRSFGKIYPKKLPNSYT